MTNIYLKYNNTMYAVQIETLLTATSMLIYFKKRTFFKSTESGEEAPCSLSLVNSTNKACSSWLLSDILIFSLFPKLPVASIFEQKSSISLLFCILSNVNRFAFVCLIHHRSFLHIPPYLYKIVH